MAEALTITITARDGASQTFKLVGGEAQKMGDAVEKAGERGSKGMARLKTSATEVGAGIGTAVSALSLLGQASQAQERSIASLERSYGSASDEILAFTERIQDSTRFSNDQARSAAETAATLARNYGFTTDQIEQLISRSADLATTSGNTLTYATEAVSAAMRGEAEQAEQLGLTLNDAAVARYAATQGISDYSTGLTEAERAQVRFNYLLDQSTFAQGAAAEAADSVAGRTQHFVNELQDGAQALGGFLGPAAEVASVAGQLAFGLPLAGAGLAKVGVAAKTAGTSLAALRVGGLAVGAAAGPIGLVVAAAGLAGLALFEYSKQTDEVAEAQKAAAGAVDGLTASIARQAAAGQDTSYANQAVNEFERITGAAGRLQTQLDSLAVGYNNNPALYDTPNERAGAVRGRQILEDRRDLAQFTQEQTEAAAAALDSILAYQGENVQAVRTNLDLIFATFEQHPDADFLVRALTGLNTNLDIIGLTATDANGNVVALSEAFNLLTDSLLEGTDAASAFREQYEGILEFAKGDIISTEEGLLSLINLYQDIEAAQRAAGNTTGADETRLLINAAGSEYNEVRLQRIQLTADLVRDATSAIFDGTGALEDETVAIDKNSKAWKGSAEERRKAAEEAATARRESIASVTESYQSALGQNSFDAPFLEGLDAMVDTNELTQTQADAIRASFDAIAASGGTTLEIVNALAEGLGYSASSATLFAQEMDKAVQSTHGVLDLYGTIDSLGSVLENANGIASDLFGEGGDAFDGVGPLRELLDSGRISQEEFNAAVQAGIDIQADNARGQAALNEIRADQLPLLAEQTENLADYYERLSGYSAEEQRHALYLADSANQQKLLNIQQLVYANSIGQIPDNVTTDLLVNAAQADPELAKILEQMGLVEIGANGEITVTLPDGEETATTLGDINSTLEQLVSILSEIAGYPDPFATIIERAQKLAGIDFDNLNGIGGLVGAFGDNGGPAVARSVTEGEGDGIERGLPSVPRPFQTPTTPTRTAPRGTPENPYDQTAYQDPARAGSASDGNITKIITFELEIDRSRFQQGLTDSDGEIAAFIAQPAKARLDANNAALLESIGEGGKALIDLDGSEATVFALGDNDDALREIGASALALENVDGDSAELTIKGRDAYSGTISDAKRFDGSILSTSYVDIVTRQFTKSAFFANGGVVGYADGGVIPSAANGRVVRMNENGGELVTLPGGALITPAPASRERIAQLDAAAGGQTINLHFYGDVNSAEELLEKISAGMSESYRQSKRAFAGMGV